MRALAAPGSCRIYSRHPRFSSPASPLLTLRNRRFWRIAPRRHQKRDRLFALSVPSRLREVKPVVVD